MSLNTKLQLGLEYEKYVQKIEEYKKFIINKNKINDETKEFYEKTLFRKLNFRRYVKTKQSEEKLLNEIQNKFLTTEEQYSNKKILLLFGNYSRTSQMKNTLS